MIADDLEIQVARWRKRAREIKEYRGNITPIQDPAPAMKAALRVLASMQNGIDPIQECRRVCNQLHLEFDQVWLLYGHKKSAWDRDQLLKRNQAIVKMSLSGKKGPYLAARFGLSKGTISKILNRAARND